MGMDKAIEKKKGIRPKHLIWATGVIVIGFLLYKVIFTGTGSTFRAEKEKLTISTVEDGLFNDYITIIGQVAPISTIYLDAIEGGQVEERFIEEGAMVKKGDVILRLENRQLYQTILNSEAALAEKENYLRNTRINFESELIQSRKNLLDSYYRLVRKKRLFEQNKELYDDQLISREDFLQTNEDYEYEKNLLEINKIKAKNDSLIRVTSMQTLETDLGKMRQMLGLVRERLDNLKVKAPVDGQLGMLDAEIGQRINEGQRIGQINVLDNFKIKALIDEHYIDRVKREIPATFDRNGTNFNLMVRKVYPEVRNGQFEIDMVFNNTTPDNIRTGQTYHIKLELGESGKALLLPRGGFYQTTGGQWVYVLNEDEREATRRTIRIGKQNPQYYEVLEGLNAGDKVITSGYEMFGNNERITFR
jgi:HlyD family secretion protein